jgi:hypothetical protein
MLSEHLQFLTFPKNKSKTSEVFGGKNSVLSKKIPYHFSPTGSVELECSAQYAKEYTVVWIKGGRSPSDHVFLSTGTSLVIRDSRFSLRYTPHSELYTLQINDIQEVS